MFWLLAAEQRHTLALDRLNMSQAVGQAIAVAFSDKPEQSRRMIRDLLNEAVPTTTG